jgi:hypothetical protein
MRLNYWRSFFAGFMMLLVSSDAFAQAVRFTALSDAVPGKFFNAAATTADPSNPNRLIVAFNTGRDSRTWTTNDFRASTAAFSPRTAMDTLHFTVVAPVGYYVASITYSQRGSGSISRTGYAAGASNWVVGGRPLQLGFFGTNPTLSSTANVSDMRWRVVPVAITTSLFAYATPVLGSATVAVTAANVVVTLAKFE